MRLYYGLTNYHLLCCILHKIIYGKNEQSIFVASQGILKNRMAALKKNGIFKEVYYLEDTDIRNRAFNSLNKKSTQKEIENRISIFVAQYDKLLPFNIKDFSEIYLNADHGALGIYVLAKQYKYNYIEDGRGIYSNWKILDDLLKIKNPGLEKVCAYLNAYGRSEFIINRYIALDSQGVNYTNNDFYDFMVDKLLSSLPKSKMKKILNIFDVKKHHFYTNRKKALILTQRFSTYKMLDDNECILLYALLADFFAPDCEIYLKPHPADKSEYIKLFDKKSIIDREMPSELLPYSINAKFDIGICTYSSSINSLKNDIDKIYNIDKSIVDKFKDIFKIYAIFELAKSEFLKVITNSDKLFYLFEEAYNLNSNNIVGYECDGKNFKATIRKTSFDGNNMIMRISLIDRNNRLNLNINKNEYLYIKLHDLRLKESFLNFNLDKTLKLSRFNIKVEIKEIKKGDDALWKNI